MQISKLTLFACLLTVMGCSRSPKLFQPLPMPQLTALTCELTAVHDGALNPDYERGKPGSVMKLTITALNDKAGSAQLIGNVGTADVLFRRSEGQMQFLEQTPSGNPTLLNVYAPPEPGKALPAAYSRHVLVSPANIAISQYAGSCQPKF
jgi:hypothetical protein